MHRVLGLCRKEAPTLFTYPFVAQEKKSFELAELQPSPGKIPEFIKFQR